MATNNRQPIRVLVVDDEQAVLDAYRQVLGKAARSSADREAMDELLAHLSPCDLVLIEGFKQEPIPKLEVHRPENGKPPLFPDRPDIVAVATDADIATTLPKLPLNDISAIADFVMNTLHLQARPC